MALSYVSLYRNTELRSILGRLECAPSLRTIDSQDLGLVDTQLTYIASTIGQESQTTSVMEVSSPFSRLAGTWNVLVRETGGKACVNSVQANCFELLS